MNGWILIARSTENPRRYKAVCPRCSLEVMLEIWQAQRLNQCARCDRRDAKKSKGGIPQAIRDAAERRYAEHLIICTRNGISPASFDTFLNEIKDDPSLGVSESIMHYEDVRHPSPLSWVISKGEGI